ncbi:hypothetical protein AB0J47_02540 [Nocardia sp. NPDC049737]|uniref:hypothetical protein n=1 Tax=Nocardia sp. NPDC049737 TaxID=3154358 RepID=UPI0034331872
MKPCAHQLRRITDIVQPSGGDKQVAIIDQACNKLSTTRDARDMRESGGEVAQQFLRGPFGPFQ